PRQRQRPVPPAAAEEAAPPPPQGAPPAARPSAPTPSDAALRDAFYRGLGIAPPDDGATTEAEMEALGARFRALTEGLMAMLRARSQEKQNVRVAQTVIGSADVNPLKFLATPAEGVDALVRPRGPGYLDPDAAISAAYRDLADHQMRTWVALQAALRRMIDRFDPAEIEKELQDMGLIETWLSGGRGAKLWQLYEERYREIAESAEDRFLGEVGADFREAYEDGQGR
ncbi:type VI secretion system-associated FHA domain protein TagH, partial [Rhodovulum iodosum]